MFSKTAIGALLKQHLPPSNFEDHSLKGLLTRRLLIGLIRCLVIALSAAFSAALSAALAA